MAKGKKFVLFNNSFGGGVLFMFLGVPIILRLLVKSGAMSGLNNFLTR